MTAARSVSRYAAALLEGPRRQGEAIGHGYVRFDSDVIAITPAGAPRMPNGIEADLELAHGEPLTIGDGTLETATATVSAGPIWDARPKPRHTVQVRPRPELDLERLPGRGPGLTPLGDDILVGYLAAAALDGRNVRATAARAARRTTTLGGTLLRLAAQAELPEAAHRLLEDGDIEPLLRFGHTSGAGIALGLGLHRTAAGTPQKTTPIGVNGRCYELTITEIGDRC